MSNQPIRPPSRDGYYPRCVWCNGENYMPQVYAYSCGDVPCAAVHGCGRYLPASYVKEGFVDDVPEP